MQTFLRLQTSDIMAVTFPYPIPWYSLRHGWSWFSVICWSYFIQLCLSVMVFISWKENFLWWRSCLFGIRGHSMLYSHIWRFGARDIKWERTCGMCPPGSFWVTLPSIIFPRSISSPENLTISFFFTVWIIFLCAHVPHCYYLSIGSGPLGCFHFLVIVNTVMSMALQGAVE